MFLVGTHIQANMFVPFIFLMTLMVYQEGKQNNSLLMLLGGLIGIGMYFNFLYYILLFIPVAVLLTKKLRLGKKFLVFLLSFAGTASPFFIYLIVRGDLSAWGRENIYSHLFPSMQEGPLALFARLKFLFSRNYEIFVYQTPKIIGSILCGAAVISLLYALFVRKKRNKIIFYVSLIFIFINFARGISRFDISGPVNGLFWNGSGRYFFFGLEIVFLLIAYFITSIDRKAFGKVFVYLLLAGFVVSSVLFLASQTKGAPAGRNFAKGYHYQDIGSRLYFWHNRDFHKAYDIVLRKVKKQEDRQELINGLTASSLRVHFAEADDVDPARLKMDYPADFLIRYNNTFLSYFGDFLFEKHKNNLPSLSNKLFRIREKSQDEYEQIAGSMRETIPIVSFLPEDKESFYNDFLRREGAALDEAVTKILKYRVLDDRSVLFPTEKSYQEIHDFHSLLWGDAGDKKTKIVQKYYVQVLTSIIRSNNFGTLQKVQYLIKNHHFPYKEKFIEEAVKLYAPYYGDKATRRLLN
jgi:hypothetical protein